jgi:hypothetical protein
MKELDAMEKFLETTMTVSRSESEASQEFPDELTRQLEETLQDNPELLKRYNKFKDLIGGKKGNVQ